MSDDLERLNRLLDDLAAERDPRDRAALSADEVELAQTAAMLKAANFERSAPDDEFIARLGAQLAAASEDGAPATPVSAPATPAAPAAHLSRRGALSRFAAAVAGLAAGAGAGELVRGQVDQAAASTAFKHGYKKGQEDGAWDALTAPLHTPMVPQDRGTYMPTGFKVSDVKPGHPVRFRVGAVEGFLINPGHGQEIYALSAACTHMGCMISWLDSASTFLCPCHGAQYHADGKVLSGIARHPLPRLKLFTDAGDRLFVWTVSENPSITTVLPYSGP